MKKMWNNPDTPVYTDEGRIRDIIHSKVKTALERLITTETLFLFLVIPLIPMLFVLDYFLGGLYTFPIFIKLTYAAFCAAGIVWQIYKRRLLKKADIVNTGIVACRKCFLKYRLCLKFEIIVGIVFFLVLHTAFVYSWREIMTPHLFGIYCWFNVALVLVMLALIFYIYKRVYYKQIRKIEASLDEIEDMEKEG